MSDLDIQWANEANKHLKGKTIEEVRYMTEDEVSDNMWYKRAIVIHFTDGTIAYPVMDDEGNDGGAMYFQDDNKTHVIPTL